MLHIRRLLPLPRHRSSTHDLVLEKATREAEAGRRLVMYDRQTGLFASWYIERRFAEELRRADRYGHALSVMVIEVAQGAGFAAFDQICEWLGQRIRSSDLATHLGEGRYLVFVPETDAVAAGLIAGRLQEHFPNVISVGLASYPEDGLKLSELRDAAERRRATPRVAV